MMSVIRQFILCLLASMCFFGLSWADEKKTYLGSFVGPSLPGYGFINESGIVVWEDGSEFTEIDGHTKSAYDRASAALTALCRKNGGIGIVNFRIDMELGRLSRRNAASIEVREQGVKYLLYGDCVLSAVPLDVPPEQR